MPLEAPMPPATRPLPRVATQLAPAASADTLRQQPPGQPAPDPLQLSTPQTAAAPHPHSPTAAAVSLPGRHPFTQLWHINPARRER